MKEGFEMNLENTLEIIKPYDNKKIRTVWDKEEEKYYCNKAFRTIKVFLP